MSRSEDAPSARLGLLCLFIVVIGMIRPRISEGAAGWLLLAFGLITLGGAGAFPPRHRAASQSPCR